MHINRVRIQNFKRIRNLDVTLGTGINVIVGDNETGKSTFLEAINLTLRQKIQGRPINSELNPYLFHRDAVSDFFEKCEKDKSTKPPEIVIEVFFSGDGPAVYRGTHNELENDCPGLRLTISLDSDFETDFRYHIENLSKQKLIPTEYFTAECRSFAGKLVKPRGQTIPSIFIDPGTLSNTHGASRYIQDIISDLLTKEQATTIAASYRHLKETFYNDPNIAVINEKLKEQAGSLTDKTLSVGLDLTGRTSWETSIIPHLNDIPLPLTGKGEQTTVKIKVALESSEPFKVLLLEEPENHLSHTNLNRLIDALRERCQNAQVLISTHSSFVLNKLGLNHIVIFGKKNAVPLGNLPKDDRRFFTKAPAQDTLRMILSERTILVEGPSDELVVTKAFEQKYGKTPLEAGVEVISVKLAFKRFFQIAAMVGNHVTAITDNDGKYEAKREWYKDHERNQNIRVSMSSNNSLPTLEPQLLEVNGLQKLNKVFRKEYYSEEDMLNFMDANKTECALMFLETNEDVEVPGYIYDAV